MLNMVVSLSHTVPIKNYRMSVGRLGDDISFSNDGHPTKGLTTGTHLFASVGTIPECKAFRSI